MPQIVDSDRVDAAIEARSEKQKRRKERKVPPFLDPHFVVGKVLPFDMPQCIIKCSSQEAGREQLRAELAAQKKAKKQKMKAEVRDDEDKSSGNKKKRVSFA